jgi:very-short-patch-repair endonuclease
MNSSSTPDKRLTTRRTRELRRNSTDAENKLWNVLRDRQLNGVKFRRQVAIGPFIADFCTLERKLIVEIDGGQHEQRSREDAARTLDLASRGFEVLRFWNDEVLLGIEGVLEVISAKLNHHS